MKSQKQETSSKLSLEKSINCFVVTGEVCCNCEFRMAYKRLFARTRIKFMANTNASYGYVDIFGFGPNAKVMNLICHLGNKIYVEAHLSNKIYLTKKGIKKAKMYFIADNIKLLAESTGAPDAEEQLEIMDELDPINYL